MAAPDRHRRGTAEVRPFHVRLVEGRRRTVLEFTGDCDMATHRHARDAIDAAWATGTSSIVIDLTGVEFMDSSGVMHLLEAQRAAEASGRELSLRLGGPVRRIMELCGVLQYFALEP